MCNIDDYYNIQEFSTSYKYPRKKCSIFSIALCDRADIRNKPMRGKTASEVCENVSGAKTVNNLSRYWMVFSGILYVLTIFIPKSSPSLSVQERRLLHIPLTGA